MSKQFVILFSLLFWIGSYAYGQEQIKHSKELKPFLTLISESEKSQKRNAIRTIDRTWKSSYGIMVLEALYFGADAEIRLELLTLLQEKTGRNFGYNTRNWYKWFWNQKYQPHKDYHLFKALLHKKLDSRFETYFLNRQEDAQIRFDEIVWGGVLQDGIPPLRNPEMISAQQANYLADDNIVFGIEINGDYRAYPKRILAWHELFTDTVGGIPVAGVYCTLCGTVVLYKSEGYQLGTSGFLYRSNKLMYDQKTQSLWNTLWGKPVVGPLVGKDIELEYLSVVTTTWGEWKQRHPETTVLSLRTGHRRNYNEGEAYKDYFSTDKLMFDVPKISRKLKNKQSILAIRFPNSSEKPLAISVKFLQKNPIYADQIGTQKFVVFTDQTGANRVYEKKNNSFVSYDQNKTVSDASNQQWILYEDRLESSTGEVLKRIPTFNAFWFGWKAAYPDTRLVK
jgi:hypothetical protein